MYKPQIFPRLRNATRSVAPTHVSTNGPFGRTSARPSGLGKRAEAHNVRSLGCIPAVFDTRPKHRIADLNDSCGSASLKAQRWSTLVLPAARPIGPMRYAVGEKAAQVLQDKMTEEKSCQAASLLRKIKPEGVQSESRRLPSREGKRNHSAITFPRHRRDGSPRRHPARRQSAVSSLAGLEIGFDIADPARRTRIHSPVPAGSGSTPVARHN